MLRSESIQGEIHGKKLHETYSNTKQKMPQFTSVYIKPWMAYGTVWYNINMRTVASLITA